MVPNRQAYCPRISINTINVQMKDVPKKGYTLYNPAQNEKFTKKILFLEHPVHHFFLHLLRSGNEFDQVLKHLFNLNSECEDDGFQIFPVSLSYFL